MENKKVNESHRQNRVSNSMSMHRHLHLGKRVDGLCVVDRHSSQEDAVKQKIIDVMKEELRSQKDGAHRGRHPQDLGWVDFDGHLVQLDGWVDLGKMADAIVLLIKQDG
jgi:hypothetical protein